MTGRFFLTEVIVLTRHIVHITRVIPEGRQEKDQGTVQAAVIRVFILQVQVCLLLRKRRRFSWVPEPLRKA